ncbi:serine hydrolase domain-containing protein [Azotosporobacter soli]|uniref:serine hydrolase domain-containing protein n=1 Tax=Azotosporobacter soli TaxID=3055040 RepID=UPI0031FEB7CE
MGLKQASGRGIFRTQRLLDGGGLVAFLLLTTGLIWGLLSAPSQLAEPLPLPPLAKGEQRVLEQYASELIMDEMSRNTIVGLSAAIIAGDRIVWAKGFGYADREAKQPATPDTVYRVGSISKIPNAIAVLKFNADGKVDLDEPVKRYIPELVVKSRFAAAPPFTPRQLMTHHSGLPSDIVKGMWGEQPAPFQSVVSLLKDEYIAYPPGTIHSYCNLGAGLLGVMLERVSGAEYDAVMQETVLQPLGMENSSYYLRSHMEPKLSKGYNKKGQPDQEVSMRDIPAGNLYTSVNDLSNMMMLLLNDGVYKGEQLLPATLVSEMLTAQNNAVPLDGNFKIGYEFFLQNPAFSYVGDDFSHGGHMYLFHGQVMGVKKEKVAVVVLANSAGAAERVKLIAEQLLKGAIAVNAGLLPPTTKPGNNVAALLPDLPQAASYAGSYGTVIGLLEVQETHKGAYTAKLQGNKVELLPDKENWLRPQYRLFGILPLSHPKLQDMRIAFRTVNGEDVVFIRMGKEIAAVGKRIVNYNLPQAWRNRQGVYHTNDVENQLLGIDSLELKVNKQGILLMNLTTDTKAAQLGELVLYPVSDQEAVIYALGRRMMETIWIRQEKDGEKLIFSGVSFKKQQK